MTQNWEFLFGYTNLVVNGMIILVVILDYVVYKFRELQEAELEEQNDRLLLLTTQDKCHRFSLDQMQRATSNFHDELVIGKGGFGNVYKGTLKVGPNVVAIKRLHSRSSQGPLEFRTEIEMLSKFRHSHLVSLIGYCDDGYEMILVYEFMPGGTLADHLYKRVRQGGKFRPTLSWVQRLKVCIGAARGLDYLHTGTGILNRIIHRDVKTTNILLDENLEAKISDFGLSKISPANQTNTYVSTHVKGTFGYLDPYYFSTHRLTRKSDVYSFGVVLLEVLCGRPAVDKTLDGEQMGLAGWAQHCFNEGLLGHIIDPKIKEEASPDCLEAFVKVAIQCLQFGPKHRPNMAEVVVALESALVLQEKINEYILPEIIISDDHQDVEAADSKKLTVGVSKGRHQEKQSSIKMTFTKRFISYKGHMQNFLPAIGGSSKVAHYPPSNPRKMKLNRSTHQHELFWPKTVMRKFLNISAKVSDYSADAEDDYTTDTEFDTEEFFEWPTESRYKDVQGNDVDVNLNGALPRSRRRKSKTFRAQYIDEKEIKIHAGTWNVGGKLPPDHLEIEDWLNISDPADMYVIGFQEIIPLNAGNIFGAEDNRPVPKWENIIRETLDKIQTGKPKCYSDRPSPIRFKPSADAPDIEDKILLETGSDGEGDGEEEIYPLHEEPNIDEVSDGPVAGLTWFGNGDASFPASETNLEDSEFNAEASVPLLKRRLARTISGTKRIGLSWPEPPLDLLAQCVPERPDSVRSFKSFKASKSFKTSNSFKLSMNVDQRVQPELASLAEIDHESLINRKRRSQYVRIVSKQMVGLFLTIWVRRSLRRHIQNVNVSTVGVGVMGYIGNKGSISVSMSIFQTLFCIICTQLTSGDKDAEAIKRNADVHEIHRRTHFNSFSGITLSKSIHDHERIIWLGDLNYRISLPYETTRQLISKKEWSKLLECDQLIRELRKGRTFDGWSEGTLNFPPTYKYEVNSEKYYGEDPKVGRRTPAWCDRILSYGKGIKLMSYRRTELMMSDHRPVSATYLVEVEVFSSKKLQRALTFTDAEIEDCQAVSNI